jgi:CheY-like chemotaxis protein
VYGHDTHLAPDGGRRMEQSGPLDFDAALLSIGPRDAAGYEAVAALKRMRRPSFVVAVTEQGGELDQRLCPEAGVDLHLIGPVHPAKLVGVFARFQRVVRGD